jgi:hypothetical protein
LSDRNPALYAGLPVPLSSHGKLRPRCDQKTKLSSDKFDGTKSRAVCGTELRPRCDQKTKLSSDKFVGTKSRAVRGTACPVVFSRKATTPSDETAKNQNKSRSILAGLPVPSSSHGKLRPDTIKNQVEFRRFRVLCVPCSLRDCRNEIPSRMPDCTSR